MKLIIVDKKETSVKTENETLVIDRQKIPFRLIDTLLLVGSHTLKTSDITRLSDAGIQSILLSANMRQSAIVSTASGKSAELKLAQYHAATRYPLTIAREILTQKISSHIAHLKKHDITLPDADTYTQKIADAKELDTLLGIEGSFSRLYFGHYFTLFPKTLHKGKRSRRPPLDPLNALLSLYYTLFYNLIAVRLMGYGFEPSIGFLHRPFRAHLALASDILELFRADINAFVYDIFTQKIVTPGDFTKRGGVYLRYEGRRKLWQPFRTFHASLEPRIDEAIAHIRSKL